MKQKENIVRIELQGCNQPESAATNMAAATAAVAINTVAHCTPLGSRLSSIIGLCVRYPGVGVGGVGGTGWMS